MTIGCRKGFRILPFLFAGAALSAFSSRAMACAVCFGDPDSPLTKGAFMGVFFLVGVVGFVLAGITGTGLFWIHRSRKLSRPQGPATPPARRS